MNLRYNQRMKKYAILFVFLLGLSIWRTSTAATDPVFDATFWQNEYTRLEAIYRSQWHMDALSCMRLPQRDGNTLLWSNANQALPSYLTMYQWSGDRSYLDRFVERADQIVSYAYDHDGDGIPGWPTMETGAPVEHEIFDLGIAAVLLRFANEHGSMYPEAAQRYRAIALQMGPKWEHRWMQLEDGRGAYLQAPNGTIPPQSLALNKQAIAGLYHYEAGNVDRVQATLRTIEGAMRPHPTVPGAIVWNYYDNILPGDYRNNPPTDDMSHAGMVIMFMLRAKPELQPALLQTALGAWDGGHGFSWAIDGSREMPADKPPHTYYIPYHRHMELGPGLYEAVAAQWKYLMEPEAINCKAGSYLSIVALILLHQFPQQRVWLPVIQRSGAG